MTLSVAGKINLETNRKMAIFTQEIYWSMLMGSTPEREWGKQNCARGEVILQCSHDKGFGWSQRELRNWDDPLKLSHVGAFKNHTDQSLGMEVAAIPREATPKEEVTEICQWPTLPTARKVDTSIQKEDRGDSGRHPHNFHYIKQYRPGFASELSEGPNYF